MRLVCMVSSLDWFAALSDGHVQMEKANEWGCFEASERQAYTGKVRQAQDTCLNIGLTALAYAGTSGPFLPYWQPTSLHAWLVHQYAYSMA